MLRAKYISQRVDSEGSDKPFVDAGLTVPSARSSVWIPYPDDSSNLATNRETSSLSAISGHAIRVDSDDTHRTRFIVLRAVGLHKTHCSANSIHRH